ncbi:MAG: HK97 family phage prohead protease [Syntrophothermus sp.]
MRDPEMIRQDFAVTVQSSNMNERTVTCIIVSNQTNRGGRRIDIEGCQYDDYLKSPVVLAFHDDTKVIGRCLWLKFGDEGIIAKFEFRNSGLANDIYSLYKEGFLTSWSIGFMPVDWQYENENGAEVMHIKKWVLLEVSAVSIPMDANAITLAFNQGFIHESSLIHTAEAVKFESRFAEIQTKTDTLLSRISEVQNTLDSRLGEIMQMLPALKDETESSVIDDAEKENGNYEQAEDLVTELTEAIIEHINTRRGIL